ncbi:hypothetical protein DRJ16_00090 [Candidatus Woesearchaeota archaeon]|nr:MAG: hypothetical protein DRJ16_00090 [Candidatus Woesearchaeota archaeon]
MKAMASVSGGKDSIAMALKLWETNHRFTIVSVFTEFEFPAIKHQVYKLIKLTNLPYKILETPKGTWNKWFYGKITKGKLKGQTRGVRFVANKKLPNCWYRREAKTKLLKRINEQFDIIYVGIRYDEKDRIRKKPKFKYPLVEWKWTKKDVKKYLKEKGFWIKEYGLFPHTGCFLCPYQTKKAWLTLKTHYPELFKIALRYHYENMKLVGLPIIPNGIELQKAFKGVVE